VSIHDVTVPRVLLSAAVGWRKSELRFVNESAAARIFAEVNEDIIQPRGLQQGKNLMLMTMVAALAQPTH